jgi:protein gp37
VDLGEWLAPPEETGVSYGGWSEQVAGPSLLDWVIVGCESGPNRRPMRLEWAQHIVDQCAAAEVPCFVKQLPINGKVSHDMSEWPEGLRVRQWPEVNHGS